MKKRQVSRMLTTMLSTAMIVAQIGTPMGVMAAEGDEEELGDRLEVEFEEEYDQPVDEDFAGEYDDFCGVIEYEDAESVEVTVDELVPPTDVKWEIPGTYSFKIASDKPMYYGSEVYCNGNQCGAAGLGASLNGEGIGYVKTDLYPSCFSESGTYTVKVYVATDDSDDAEKIYSSEIPEISWTCPDVRIDTPNNIHWEKTDDEHFAIIVCDPVENACQYLFQLYEDGNHCSGRFTTSNRCDFSSKIGDTSEHNYFVKIRAYSNDLYTFANSLESENSPVFQLDSTIIHTQKDITELGKDVNSANVSEKVQQVKDLDNTTLKTSLQTNNAAVEAMANIEKEYASVNGITVLPATSNVDMISADQVEMIGAALNVSEGSVQLNVKNPKAEGSAMINTDIYTNILAFDMSVDSSEGIDFSRELEVPVTISMPIPDGMNTDILVILHYRADGTEELITPRIENGKAIFAITHFSTFAFAEKKDSSSGTDVPDGPAPRIIVASDGSSKVYQNGEEIQNYTGLAMLGTTETAPWVYVENNQRNEAYSGYVNYNGALFYVAGGTMASQKSGLVQDPNNTDDWYFLSGGQAQTQYTGLAQYDGAWFYVENGKLNTKLAAFVEYDGGLFFVGAGRIMKEVNGLAMDPNGSDWYYLAEGQAQISYTGLAFYDGEWFYVVKGKLAADYCGTVDYDGSTFNVENGMVVNSEPSEPTNVPEEQNESTYIVLGSYEQDGNPENGPEPIEWQVLGANEHGTLLITRYVLDDLICSGCAKWYDDFYNQAFTPQEQMQINQYSAYRNKVSEISMEELKQYFDFNYFLDKGQVNYAMGTGGVDAYSESLIVMPTKYAGIQGAEASMISLQEYSDKYTGFGYSTESMNKAGTDWFAGDWYVTSAGGYAPNGVVTRGHLLGLKKGVRPVIYIIQ